MKNADVRITPVERPRMNPLRALADTISVDIMLLPPEAGCL
jgi:hypothetical protein